MHRSYGLPVRGACLQLELHAHDQAGSGVYSGSGFASEAAEHDSDLNASACCRRTLFTTPSQIARRGSETV